jgi:hypothetical protein
MVTKLSKIKLPHFINSDVKDVSNLMEALKAPPVSRCIGCFILQGTLNSITGPKEGIGVLAKPAIRMQSARGSQPKGCPT